MNFQTTNELDHFCFQGAYIGGIQQMTGVFHLILDNVIILPENSTNRDIRKMRCNNLEIRIQDGQIIRLIEEGYKVYNANGDLTEQYEDTLIPASAYNEIFKSLYETESTIYSVKKENNQYEISIDGEERTYTLILEGTGDTEEWDRYLNLETT